MTNTRTIMGRPKKRVDPSPDALPPKSIGFRVSGEYGAWLERVADHSRDTIAGLIDRAVAEFAAAHGFEEKPPRRNP